MPPVSIKSLKFMHSSEVTVGGSGGHENVHTYGCDKTIML